MSEENNKLPDGSQPPARVNIQDFNDQLASIRDSTGSDRQPIFVIWNPVNCQINSVGGNTLNTINTSKDSDVVFIQETRGSNQQTTTVLSRPNDSSTSFFDWVNNRSRESSFCEKCGGVLSGPIQGCEKPCLCKSNSSRESNSNAVGAVPFDSFLSSKSRSAASSSFSSSQNVKPNVSTDKKSFSLVKSECQLTSTIKCESPVKIESPVIPCIEILDSDDDAQFDQNDGANLQISDVFSLSNVKEEGNIDPSPPINLSEPQSASANNRHGATPISIDSQPVSSRTAESQSTNVADETAAECQSSKTTSSDSEPSTPKDIPEIYESNKELQPTSPVNTDSNGEVNQLYDSDEPSTPEDMREYNLLNEDELSDTTATSTVDPNPKIPPNSCDATSLSKLNINLNKTYYTLEEVIHDTKYYETLRNSRELIFSIVDGIACSSDYKVKCPFCEGLYSSKSSLKVHLATACFESNISDVLLPLTDELIMKRKIISCPWCSSVLSAANHLRSHIAINCRVLHGKTSLRSTRKRTPVCDDSLLEAQTERFQKLTEESEPELSDDTSSDNYVPSEEEDDQEEQEEEEKEDYFFNAPVTSRRLPGTANKNRRKLRQVAPRKSTSESFTKSLRSSSRKSDIENESEKISQAGTSRTEAEETRKSKRITPHCHKSSTQHSEINKNDSMKKTETDSSSKSKQSTPGTPLSKNQSFKCRKCKVPYDSIAGLFDHVTNGCNKSNKNCDVENRNKSEEVEFPMLCSKCGVVLLNEEGLKTHRCDQLSTSDIHSEMTGNSIIPVTEDPLHDELERILSQQEGINENTGKSQLIEDESTQQSNINGNTDINICDVCGNTFNFASELVRHKKLHRKATDNIKIKKKELERSKTNKSKLRLRNTAKEIALVSENKSSEVCESSDLLRPETHYCPACNACTNSRSELEFHVNSVHTTNQTLICKKCFAGFLTPSALLNHTCEYDLERHKIPLENTAVAKHFDSSNKATQNEKHNTSVFTFSRKSNSSFSAALSRSLNTLTCSPTETSSEETINNEMQYNANVQTQESHDSEEIGRDVETTSNKFCCEGCGRRFSSEYAIIGHRRYCRKRRTTDTSSKNDKKRLRGDSGDKIDQETTEETSTNLLRNNSSRTKRKLEESSVSQNVEQDEWKCKYCYTPYRNERLLRIHEVRNCLLRFLATSSQEIPALSTEIPDLSKVSPEIPDHSQQQSIETATTRAPVPLLSSGLEDLPYVCKYCNARFGRSLEVTNHLTNLCPVILNLQENNSQKNQTSSSIPSKTVDMSNEGPCFCENGTCTPVKDHAIFENDEQTSERLQRLLKQRFECGSCGRDFSSTDKLKCHLTIHEVISINCVKCKKHYTCFIQFQNHLYNLENELICGEEIKIKEEPAWDVTFRAAVPITTPDLEMSLPPHSEIPVPPNSQIPVAVSSSSTEKAFLPTNGEECHGTIKIKDEPAWDVTFTEGLPDTTSNSEIPLQRNPELPLPPDQDDSLSDTECPYACKCGEKFSSIPDLVQHMHSHIAIDEVQ